MWGNNKVMGLDWGDGQTLRVQAIFDTIQGEGPFAGTPAVFIRLAGCNLRCFFCDTEFDSGINNCMHISYIIDTVIRYKRALVVITGGEPLRQNILPLLNTLVMSNHHVQIETAGTLWPEDCLTFQFWNKSFEPLGTAKVTIVCSPKTPKLAPDFPRDICYYKYIIQAGQTSVQDGLPTLSTQMPGKLEQVARPPSWYSNDHIFLSPMDVGNAQMNKHNLNEVRAVSMRFGYRAGVQLHKLMEIP